MTKPNENKKGYKLTSLGWIPNDWEEVKIKNIGKISSGTTPLRSNLAYHKNGTIPWVKTTDLNNSAILDTEEKITLLALQETSLRLYPKGTLLVAMYGGFNQIGRTGILEIEAAINQALSAISVDKNKIDRHFLLNWLNAKVGLWKNLAGSSRKDPNITSKDVSDFPFIKMSLPEQKSITAILSTWDKAIETSQQLIAQKELRKKALMQQLLTGKKRLKGFKEKWKEVKFGNVTRMFSRRNKDLLNAKVYSVTNTDGFILQSEHFKREIAGEDLSNYKIIKKNEFAYNPARINVGSIAYFENEVGIISSLYVCFSTTEEILDYYFEQVIQLDHTKHKIGSYGEGGVRVYLWYDLFSRIRITLPSVEEQAAIANVLQTADKELELLRQKLDAFKEQKKGLMQKLFTGQIRVKH